MYGLRYYCPDDSYWHYWKEDEVQQSYHRQTLELMEKIRKLHQIPCEVIRIPVTPLGGLDETVEQKIYREDIWPWASILLPRLEEDSLRRCFKSRSGNLYISGRVIVVEDDHIGWATGSNASFRRFVPKDRTTYRPDRLDFLDAVLQRGTPLLKELCFIVEGTPERRLLDRFRRSGIITGIYRENVWLPELKQIDVVCEADNHVWLFEGKITLNWQAYGQIRGYTLLYGQGYPKHHVYSGIVCQSSDAVIEDLCRKDNIAVFVETAEGFENRGGSGLMCSWPPLR